VRTGPTKAGHYLYWESGCIFMTVDAAGTREVAGDAEFPVIDASIETWNTDTASCSYMVMMDAGKKAMEVGKDHINLIKFRDDSWCRPAVDGDPARCYDSSAAGITTATYVDDASSSRDGAIVDADVEINGHDFAIAVNGVTLGTASCQSELQNTLTHELGHVHGLEHTCLAAGDPPRIDGSGNAVPTCASSMNNPAITEPTMYNFQDCGETKKETLEPDDINAICTIYPTAKDPKTCAPVGSSSGCGCDTSNPGSPALLLGFVLLGLRRRRG
jgi:MYXO-CTERM domain-containing protein